MYGVLIYRIVAVNQSNQVLNSNSFEPLVKYCNSLHGRMTSINFQPTELTFKDGRRSNYKIEYKF